MKKEKSTILSKEEFEQIINDSSARAYNAAIKDTLNYFIKFCEDLLKNTPIIFH